MKIWDCVRLSLTLGQGPRAGVVTKLCGDQAIVVWADGKSSRHHQHVLIEVEPFPYRSHRTMAEVIQDEQKPVPA